LCGDFTAHNEEFTNMIGPFLQKGKKVFLMAGNHETPEEVEFIAGVYNVKTLHGEGVVYDNVGIFGSGGVDIGLKGISEEEIFSNLKKGFEKIKSLDRKIMVTHVHPSGTKMEQMTPFFPPSPAVRAAVDRFKPDILICGHVHEAAGLEEQIGKTRVINVSKNGKIIEL
ncbi:MAG: metallophosphoesterase, partial [Nanoarchaeota archaeon]|nr:metallophosphoesterase [Nanoarchaeota archaeon]